LITIELIDAQKINSIIPLLQVLNTTITEETLEQRLGDMINEGYQCIGAFDNKKLIGICGLWVLTKYYVGKHIEPDNMIILPEYQNKDIGSKMMQWIYNYAKDNDCVSSELNCYIDNKPAHKFWEKENYKVIALHFQKDL